MVAVPAAIPVTTPVVASTVASDVLLLLQLPPAVASVSVAVKPAQTFDVPPMLAGELTLTTAVAIQPAPRSYVMLAVPLLTAVSTPLDEPIVAIAVLLLVHVPPAAPPLSVDVVAAQRESEPVIDAGVPTVTTFVAVEAPHAPVTV